MFFSTKRQDSSTMEAEQTATRTTKDWENWFARNVQRGRAEMFSVVVTVTPDLARLLLSKNNGNRPLRPARVKRLASLMKSGRWVLTHQGISFTPAAVLNDGQHRLSAVIEAGLPVPMSITFGEPREAFAFLDTQARRGGADVLAIAGHKSTVLLASVARLLWNIENGTTKSELPIDNDTLLEAVQAFGDLPASVTVGQTVAKALKCASTGLCVGHYLASQKYGQETAIFFETLKTGLGLSTKGNPIYRLRERLIQEKRLPSIESAALVIKAWNAYRTQKPVKTLSWKRSIEDFPEVE